MQNLRMNLNVKNYRLEDLPATPFAIWRLNAEGEVYPKQVFTVTKKEINAATLNIEFHLLENQDIIEYDPKTVHLVALRFVN